MKQRIISAAVGLIIFFVILIGFQTIAFNIAVSLIVGIAVFELLGAVKLLHYKWLSGVSLAFSMLIPFMNIDGMLIVIKIASVFYPAFLFAVLLKKHSVIHFEQIALCFMISTIFPFALTTLVLMRDRIPDYGIYYLLLTFTCAWGADSGAYFIGRFFGKHKLAPVISPNKTVEGVYGGVLGSLLTGAILCVTYYYIMLHFGHNITINVWVFILFAITLALVGVVGDLSCSAIKRQFQVKDFGKIMPGHGGVMDRFDSVIFIAPVMYLFIQFIHIVS